MKLPAIRARRAARRGAVIAANTPDPARAVKEAQWELGDHADRYRISVSRPGVVGRLARVTVSRKLGPFTIKTTAKRKVTR